MHAIRTLFKYSIGEIGYYYMHCVLACSTAITQLSVVFERAQQSVDRHDLLILLEIDKNIYSDSGKQE